MTETPSTKPSPETVHIRDSPGAIAGSHNKIKQYFQGRAPVSWPQQIGVPPRPKDFHRRSATKEFELDGWGRTVIATGLGGVGKTQLAADFAQRAQQGRPTLDLLVWVAADSSASITALFGEAAQRLQLEGADTAGSARRFVDWLATTERRWLVVLDDLYEPADVGDLWPPDRPSGCTVVTTRRRDAGLLARGAAVQVGAFSAEEAVTFLRDNLGPSPSAELLAADLGYLPLALAHAVAYIRDLDLSCDEYRERLADRGRRLDELFAEFSAGSGHARAVDSTWQVSIDAANQARPSGIARPVLELASQLDANGIPTLLFTTPPAQQWISARTGDPTKFRPTDCADALAVLHRFNLLVNERATSLARVHALVQRAVRESLRADGPAAARTAADALVEVWPDVEQDPAQGDLLRTNAFALYSHHPDALWTADGNHPVLDRANLSLGDGALLDHAIRHAREMCAESERRLGREHRCTFRWRRELAGWQGDAGSGREAAETLQGVVADAEALLGHDDPVALNARATLAYQRGQAGDPAAAAAQLQDVAVDMARVYGPTDRATLSARNQAGYWMGKGGHPDQAVIFLEPVLADATAVLRAEDRLMLDIRHNHGYWLASAGDPAAALPTLQAVLDDAERALGPHHRDVSGYRSNLAYWRGQAGDLKGAVDALGAVLDERLDMFGLYHRNTLASWTGYLKFRIQLGERGDILDEARQLVTIYTDVHGPRHHETLTARELLADLRGLLGDHPGAAADLRAILTDREAAFPDDVRAIAQTRAALQRWLAH
ncbi:NB-ARC domain-containing protein [Mycolicibacterium sp.]|uniref:NB-ARC domain-containing protein n=3 Tax=Mycolicibacterium sp. TaxID=2320850 RepID=UPI003D0D9EA4